MSEEEIIETFKHWIEYEKLNKDKINKADELIEIQQGILDLYQKEKEQIQDLENTIDRILDEQTEREKYIHELEEKSNQTYRKQQICDLDAINHSSISF